MSDKRDTFDRKHDELISASRIANKEADIAPIIAALDEMRQAGHKRSLMPDIDALMLAAYNQNAQTIATLRNHFENIAASYGATNDAECIEIAAAHAMSKDMAKSYEVLNSFGFKRRWSRVELSHFISNRTEVGDSEHDAAPSQDAVE